MAATKMALRGGKRPMLRKRESRSFTPAKQKGFLAELAATCNVSAACRKARVSKPTVYEHRRKSAAFRAGWREAVREAYAALELMMLERAMNGTVRTVTGPDGSVVRRIHEYSDSLALTLLRLHRDTIAEAEAELDPEDDEEVRLRLADKLERLGRRIRAEAGSRPDGPSTEPGTDSEPA